MKPPQGPPKIEKKPEDTETPKRDWREILEEIQENDYRNPEDRIKDRIRAELKKIYPITFFKQVNKLGKRIYRSIPLRKWPKEHELLLEDALTFGIIVKDYGTLILADRIVNGAGMTSSERI